MATELLRELAPLPAGEGIDVGNIDVPDLDTLQQAMNRAIERQNMARFTPVGQARELAAVTLRLVAEAIADGDTRLAAAGERAATDIVTLARKGRAFACLDALIARQGGQHVLYGSALALGAALQAWSQHASTPLPDLARMTIR